LLAALAPLHSLVGLTASDYAGAAACVKCHPGEYKAQSSSAHARALAPSKSPLPGLWAFGAGVQAITFVSRLNAEIYAEEDQTWYRKLNSIAARRVTRPQAAYSIGSSILRQASFAVSVVTRPVHC